MRIQGEQHRSGGPGTLIRILTALLQKFDAKQPGYTIDEIQQRCVTEMQSEFTGEDPRETLERKGNVSYTFSCRIITPLHYILHYITLHYTILRYTILL